MKTLNYERCSKKKKTNRLHRLETGWLTLQQLNRQEVSRSPQKRGRQPPPQSLDCFRLAAFVAAKIDRPRYPTRL